MMTAFIRKILKKAGIKFDMLAIPHYIYPYLFLRGKAFCPLKATIELTYSCNLTCRMCPLQNAKEKGQGHKPGTNGELTTSDLRKAIKALKSSGVKSILLTGGETFLRKDINEIITDIKNQGLYCSILSNGFFISREHAVKLVEQGVNLISFSMDGTLQTHNSIRGNSDSFQRICNSVRLINDTKKTFGRRAPNIVLNCTISAINQAEISSVMETAWQLGVETVDYMYLFHTEEEKLNNTKKILNIGKLKPENQVLGEELKKISPDLLISEVNKVKKLARQYKINASFYPALKDREIEKRFTSDNKAFCSRCFYPWFETRIDPYGNVYPCSLDVPMGNVRDKQFSQIWNGAEYVKFRNFLRRTDLPGVCTNCCKLVNRYWSFFPKMSLSQ